MPADVMTTSAGFLLSAYTNGYACLGKCDHAASISHVRNMLRQRCHRYFVCVLCPAKRKFAL